ncbi:uncharacterized protein L201_000750 [Kwoniella dendrophila CBS 6074]|uniref:DUF4211 domain-containing protein n=1 Tax=Kwoniella dendrophila CBS 6074 TaxID=1295534 RepID=A0AAX4JM21_9TREE
MPSRQTTLFSHFEPSSQTEAGPSRPRRTRNAQPLFDRGSESDGSEGLDHVKMKDQKPDVKSLPMTQRRALKKTVYDTEEENDEDEFEEEEESEGEYRQRPIKKRSNLASNSRVSPRKGKVKRKHRDECSSTDPEEEFISYPLTGWMPPEYGGTLSQKRKRRNDRLEAVEIERKNKKADILTDDEIEVFPSPPSPKDKQRRKVGRPSKNLYKDDSIVEIINNSPQKDKGKGKRKEDTNIDDEIIPIDPPPRSSGFQKGRRGIESSISRPTEPASTASSLRNTRPVGRPRLALQRTRSEVIVEIPRMSQEDRDSYRSFTPSESSQSRSKSNTSTRMQDPQSRNNSSNSSAGIHQFSVTEKRANSRPVIELTTSQRQIPVAESSRNDSLPPILEVELSDRDLDELTEGGSSDKVDQSPPKAKSKSPAKKASPLKPPSPAKAPLAATESLEPIRRPSPAKRTYASKPSTTSKASSVSSSRFLPRSPALSSDSDVVEVKSKRKEKGKGKQKAFDSSESESEDSQPIKKSRKPAPLPLKSSNKRTATPQKKKKAKIVDPDEDMGVETEDEQDMLDDIKMDEPERFKSKTRLRKRPKESAVQRNIRKLKNKRLGIIDTSSEEEEEEEEGSSSEEESDNTGSEDDSRPRGYNQESFIVSDDEEKVQLPHEFSVDSAQTPEFKFKVVFHYLVLLVMKGKKAFPLSTESSNYFKPQLLHFRDRMTGYRQLRVRSQIWRSNFVKALEKYPIFDIEELLYAQPGCDACHMGGRMSKFRITLDGEQYDKETHQPLNSSSESEPESDDSDDSKRRIKKLPKSLLMGKYCKQRAEVFHQMTHWEDELYHRIRGYYRDLLRSKYKPVPSDSEASTPESEQQSDEDPNDRKSRKEQRNQRKILTEARCEKYRKKGGLPNDTKDVDSVTEWMDKMGFQNKDFRWIERLIDQSDQLEHDKRRDE